MSSELDKIFEPVLAEQRKRGLEDAFIKLRSIVKNSNQELYNQFLKDIKTPKDFVDFLNNVEEEIIMGR